MTSISVKRTEHQVENRSWLASQHGTDHKPSVTLDVSTFTQAAHYPNGYIPSGIVVGKITATGLYGPYSATASDGREVAAGHLYNSVSVVGETKVGNALIVHGFVSESRLPSGHGLDNAAKGQLRLVGYETPYVAPAASGD
ncbi:head decoration protein [Rhodococcus rhodochrous]|uniref:head decoration protein n=1 Tax=Rhodococcus rhodochrous TaxID=1829 RepID=UPI00177F8019|nr:head decoration protein [Rhodococcus rhodochrous]QOH55250.1 head decoration protein [Rhodococcus rhodochrous]